MSLTALERAIPDGDRILLETTVLVAYFNSREVISPIAAHIIDSWIDQGRNEAVVSMVTVMELLVRPLQRGARGYRHVLDFLVHYPHLHTAEIDLQVAQEAASLRAQHKFATPDALIIGTGLVHQVGHLITNDHQWHTKLQPIVNRVRVCELSSYTPFP